MKRMAIHNFEPHLNLLTTALIFLPKMALIFPLLLRSICESFVDKFEATFDMCVLALENYRSILTCLFFHQFEAFLQSQFLGKSDQLGQRANMFTAKKLILARCYS